MNQGRAFHLIFFGDSICFGQFVSPHKTWVTRISRAVEDLHPEKNIVAINTSINGNTTRMALERMPYDVQGHGADLILIQFGMNDCNYWQTDKGHPRVSPKGFEANLSEIIARARIFGAKRVILNTNHPTPKSERFSYAESSYEESNQRYNGIIRKVASSEKVILADVGKEFQRRVAGGAELSGLVLADGVHLSEAGHDIYFQCVLPVVTRALEGIL